MNFAKAGHVRWYLVSAPVLHSFNAGRCFLHFYWATSKLQSKFFIILYILYHQVPKEEDN